MPVFLSNRTWFIREGIEFQHMGELPAGPKMVLLRTQTRVSLPPDWEEKAAGLPQAEEWQKRGLLENTVF